ncbi:restriction endonuclease subunit S [Aliarcobacter butzleri]|uniref:restriction endonuclease subunit S n=1 Tax=Aliarcobacter butzleri TaxID=28197 RepID=UPI001269E379|nr:restriction endonuclease subunit S [Aliarcobacter butzleri]MDN5061721.1 restriction endonuclease subunit S [Aliarcobacter butzleri]
METIVPEGYQETKLGFVPKDWNIVKLRDIATKCTKKNTDESITTVFSNSAVNGIVLQNEYFDKDIAQQGNLDGYYIVESGDFVYNPRISNNAPAGPINRNLYTQTGVVSPLYTVFRSKSNEQTNFLEHFFKSTKWLKYMMSIANYGARHDRMNVTSDDFFDMPIPIPKNQEQTKIAQILTTWDEVIEKQEELIKEKEQLKKGLLQKLLSGEVRFDGFDEDWKFVKLGDLLDYLQPTQYLVSDTNYSDEYQTPVLTAGKTFILGYTNETDGIFEDNLPVIIFDDFTTATQFVDFPFKAKSSAMKILKPKDNSVNVKLVYEIMQMINFVADDHKRYWISEYQELEIKLPSKDEQLKISEFLNAINNEISLLKNELEELKLQKKALMQKLLTGQVRVKV